MNLFSRRPQRLPSPTAPRVATADTDADEIASCGWFVSSAELRRGLSVVEHVLEPGEFARAWPQGAAIEAAAARIPACHAGARG